jgi:Skp family chaperone for outer membrane proteins
MKKHHLKVLVPGIFAAAALALAVGVGAQTTPAPAAPPAAKSPQAAPMTGHHKDSAARAQHDADLKAECDAMMAKKQEMQDKLQAMDAALDKLVAEMNAAKGSKEPDALEKPMAAVINELVAQRKASRAMMMEMQPAMMAHMMHHMDMHGAKGAMECPMMKTGNAPEPKAEEKNPKM